MTQRTFAYVHVLPHGDTPDDHDDDPETVDGPFTGSPREVIAELETSGTPGVADFTGRYWVVDGELWVELA